MDDRSFNSIFVPIAIFFYIQLDVVLLQGPNNVIYFDVSKEQDFGIKIDVTLGTQNDDEMVVTIYSDSYTESAKNFFTGQITEGLLNDIKSCEAIHLMFSPCTTLMTDQKSGEFVCTKGADQCAADETITCVWDAIINSDAVQTGTFLICFFNNPNNIDECVGKTKMDPALYKECKSSTTSKLQDCATFSTDFQNQTKTAAEKKWPHGKAINGFKSALCNLLKNNSSGCRAFCHR